MEHIAIRFIIILTLFLVIDAIQRDAREIVYSNRVLLNNDRAAEIEVKQGEEAADVVYKFGLKHGLVQSQRSELLQVICEELNCKRSRAIIWSTPVTSEETFIGTFELHEGIEPVDAVYEFVRSHNLTLGYRHAILSAACDVVECHRTDPIIWRKTIKKNGESIEIILKEGEEVADAIFSAMLPYGSSFNDREQIMKEAKRDGIQYERDHALLFSKRILLNETFNSTLDIFDNGQEPIDTIFNFTRRIGNEGSLKQLSDSILPEVCKMLPCQRSMPIVWSQPIIGADGSVLGNLQIETNEEPVDAIDRFVETFSLGQEFRTDMLKVICNQITCKRNSPVVFSQSIKDQNGQHIGDVEILEEEEVVDAVVRFMRLLSQNIQLDDITLKNYFFQNACGNPRLKCTRMVANIYNRNFTLEDGSLLGELIVTEHEEPVDKIYRWCEEKQVDDSYISYIVNKVCSDDLVFCKRKRPLVFSKPLNDPDGKVIGNLEVELDEEPVDSLYRFFAKHKLFEMGWDFPSVSNQICSLPEVTCNRNEAIKFFKRNFTMGGLEVGPITVMENEEVIDKLYQKRIEFNLTAEDQMQTFSEICIRDDVYCARTQAIIYKLIDITKKDFEKYGNETCSRKYAGWQFLSSVHNSYLTFKTAKLFELDSIKVILFHPLFSPILLCAILLLSWQIWNLPYLKRRLHIGHKVVICTTSFIFVAITQALFIEPSNEIDQAMHLHEGKLPDLLIFEDEEPVDAILRWGELAAKSHHPIVREPIHWDVLDKVCMTIVCRRKRAWESIDMGAMSVAGGVTHKITYVNPSVDRKSSKVCKPVLSGNLNSCIIQQAAALCRRIYPKIQLSYECMKEITLHMKSQLDSYNSKRLDSKNTYTKLELTMDAPHEELYPKLASIVRLQNKLNLSPFSRVDNGTCSYPRWDTHTQQSFTLIDAHEKVRNHKKREWNDKPCTPYFGGALCAKTDEDGNMIIEA